MPRPILATIHTAALRANLQALRQRAGDARIWAVVKANAYGHGIERVFDGLHAADGFAMLDLGEAQRLRALGWRGPILLLEGVFEARDLELCSRLGLWHTVHCEEQIDMLAAHKTHEAHRVFLKMNSGMNRLGFRPAQFRAAWARLDALPQVDEISLVTHFSDADGAPGIAAQFAVFQDACADLPGERSVCNSAALLRFGSDARVASDWVRAGIALYGSAPDFPVHTSASWGLQPTMSLRARIIGTQDLQAGDTVGYGSSFVAEHPMRASAWSPAATPTATRAMRQRVRRFWWAACAAAWWAASAWTCSPLTCRQRRRRAWEARPRCGAAAPVGPCCRSTKWPASRRPWAMN